MKSILVILLFFYWTATVVLAGDIKIDLSSQTLTFTNAKGKQEVAEVSTGKPQTPTPTGVFKVTEKHLRYKHQGSAKEGREIIIPYWLTLGGKDLTGRSLDGRGIGIHYFAKSFGGHYPASGACIRVVSEEVAKAIFENTNVGDTVTITGSTEEFLKKAGVWKDPEVLDLFANPKAGQGGFVFKRPAEFNQEMKDSLAELLENRKIGFYHPTQAQIRKDARWGEIRNRFLGFPGAQKSPSEITFNEACKIYLRLEEVEALLGRKIEIKTK